MDSKIVTGTGAAKWNFTFLCKKTKELQHVFGTGPGFECPSCNLPLVWIPSTRKLGSHGRDDRTIEHELRLAQEA
jgi:hypothetical protein